MSEQSKVDEYDLFMEHAIFPTVLAILPYDSDEKVPKNTSILTGKMYLEELMAENCHPTRFLECARMRKETFITVVGILEQHGGN